MLRRTIAAATTAAAIATSLLITAPAHASVTFTISSGTMSYYDAGVYCAGLGSQLADITAVNENVANAQLLLVSPTSAWIGTLDGSARSNQLMLAGLLAPSFTTDYTGAYEYHAMCNGSL